MAGVKVLRGQEVVRVSWGSVPGEVARFCEERGIGAIMFAAVPVREGKRAGMVLWSCGDPRWTSDDMRLLHEVSGQVAIGLAQARLLKEARDYRRLAWQNAELEQARNLAEAASQAKSSFLAVVSHEIRCPLYPSLPLHLPFLLLTLPSGPFQDADECYLRNDKSFEGSCFGQGRKGMCTDYFLEQQITSEPHQQHSRLFQDRGRQDRDSCTRFPTKRCHILILLHARKKKWT